MWDTLEGAGCESFTLFQAGWESGSQGLRGTLFVLDRAREALCSEAQR